MIGIPFSSTRQPSIFSGSVSGFGKFFFVIGAFFHVSVVSLPRTIFHESETGARTRGAAPLVRVRRDTAGAGTQARRRRSAASPQGVAAGASKLKRGTS